MENNTRHIFPIGGAAIDNNGKEKYDVCRPCSYDEATQTYRGGCKKCKDKSRIIDSPCWPGDTVYVLWQWDGISGIAVQEIVKIEIYKDNFYYATDMDSDDEDYIAEYAWFRPNQIGKTVFLTREEAEKELESAQKMTYKKCYLKLSSVKEIQERANADMALALVTCNASLEVIRKAAEEAITEKFGEVK